MYYIISTDNYIWGTFAKINAINNADAAIALCPPNKIS